MADSLSTLTKRVISGLLAAGIVFSLGYFGGTRGLEFVCAAAAILTIGEFARMVFGHFAMPPWIRWAYYGIGTLLYISLFKFPNASLLLYALGNITFLVVALWGSRAKVSNESLLGALAIGSFGLLYCVLFLHFGLLLVHLPNGEQWLLFLLLVVFAGDTGAYFGGRAFGQRKLMPDVSPNKTWAGALTGIGASSVAGLVHAQLVFQPPWCLTLVFCVLCGVVAQSGDLLVSLLKRVTHVKDSGQIMPGHGGLLDRLDGVFIACPLVYAFAVYVRPI